MMRGKLADSLVVCRQIRDDGIFICFGAAFSKSYDGNSRVPSGRAYCGMIEIGDDAVRLARAEFAHVMNFNCERFTRIGSIRMTTALKVGGDARHYFQVELRARVIDES